MNVARFSVILLVAALLGVAGIASFRGEAQTCGRPDYPNAPSFNADAVVDASLWRSFVELGGFAGAAEGHQSVSVAVPDGARTHVVTLEEVTVRTFVGGASVNTTSLALRVRTEADGGITATYVFTLVSASDRSGGNLTIVAHVVGGALDIFWRWAYLPCSEDFPNAYYVFHARVDGGSIADDNTLVYFEAPRPRRGPPVDLILLVTAGIAVSVIFLLARRALRKRP